ncbi:hypothetical protein J7E38_13565 [Bacillus sp. ISL-35]|uniref:hypothetical protein n=1 Tax=Bacillus sp. ISL-35 TaxID=2819122 RepID=UPI001BEB139D|nr:hypothetical protein [Bacillus sp. ISL-35]MBT2680037.1 hypothetical protein [Bacillus sp. ISL-35]MBT2702986.1 hypothetical protein [Chryseobacterium sp. ISL-80]
MEKVDFSPMKETVDMMASQLAIWILLTVEIVLVVIVVLKVLRVPGRLIVAIASITTLLAAYKVFLFLFS